MDKAKGCWELGPTDHEWLELHPRTVSDLILAQYWKARNNIKSQSSIITRTCQLISTELIYFSNWRRSDFEDVYYLQMWELVVAWKIISSIQVLVHNPCIIRDHPDIPSMSHKNVQSHAPAPIFITTRSEPGIDMTWAKHCSTHCHWCDNCNSSSGIRNNALNPQSSTKVCSLLYCQAINSHISVKCTYP